MERFKVRSLDEIDEIRKGRIPGNTKRNMKWSARTWDKWSDWRNSLQEGDFPVVPGSRDLGTVSDKNLSTFLSLFVVEVTKENGKPYPPDSLYSLVCGINRHVREELGKPAFNVFAQTEDFLKFQQALDGQMKELKR